MGVHSVDRGNSFSVKKESEQINSAIEKSPERIELEQIGRHFKISQEDMDRSLKNDNALSDRCFQNIVNCCERDEWDTINAVLPLIMDFKNSHGLTVYEFLKTYPKIYVFQGGGEKGLAYIGCMEAMTEYKKYLTEIAGASVGAITAILVSLNCTPKEICEILTELGSIWNLLDDVKFLSWVDGLIEKKTGIKHCTLGELKEKIKNYKPCTLGELKEKIENDKPFKHVHFFATKTGNNREVLYFSSEDEKYKDYIISDLVRASASLPVVFEPHVLHIKDSSGGRIPEKEDRTFMDGGMGGRMFNLPTYPFDTNEILAFSLYTPGENLPKKDEKVTGRIAGFFEYLNTVRNPQELIKKTQKNIDSHIIPVSNVNVKTVNLNLKEAKKNELLDSGRACTKNYLLDFENRLGRYKTAFKYFKPVNYKKVKGSVVHEVFKNSVSHRSFLGIEINGEDVSFYTSSSRTGWFQEFSFKKLSEKDERFNIFEALDQSRFYLASEIFERHKIFFSKCFNWEIFRRLIIERNRPEYIKFFLNKKSGTFNSTGLHLGKPYHPLWYAYERNVLESFKALLIDSYIDDLRVIQHGTKKTFLYYFAKKNQRDLAKIFCEQFKAKYPGEYQQMINYEVDSSKGVKKTALDIAKEKEHLDMINLLINESSEQTINTLALSVLKNKEDLSLTLPELKEKLILNLACQRYQGKLENLPNLFFNYYNDIHKNSSLSIGSKIAVGTLVTSLIPLGFVSNSIFDMYHSNNHSKSNDKSTCRCYICREKRIVNDQLNRSVEIQPKGLPLHLILPAKDKSTCRCDYCLEKNRRKNLLKFSGET